MSTTTHTDTDVEQVKNDSSQGNTYTHREIPRYSRMDPDRGSRRDKSLREEELSKTQSKEERTEEKQLGAHFRPSPRGTSVLTQTRILSHTGRRP